MSAGAGKPRVRFCLVGHVDSGKSTLAGHILALAQPDSREIEKLPCGTDGVPKWGSLLDIYEEERERSKTHEFSYVDFQYNGRDYTLIDTPGHKGFIREAIAGIATNPV